MTASREDSVYLAKLAEQAERYEGESRTALFLHYATSSSFILCSVADLSNASYSIHAQLATLNRDGREHEDRRFL